jgi:hypothetical protein
MEFEWALGGEILLQRSDTPVEGFPDSFSVITTDDTGRHLQHYFDSRGVVRIYQMGIDDQSWTLQRDTADFMPLHFAQRFRARITNDHTITGTWERSDDGAHWQQDFNVTYRRITTNPTRDRA